MHNACGLGAQREVIDKRCLLEVESHLARAVYSTFIALSKLLSVVAHCPRCVIVLPPLSGIVLFPVHYISKLYMIRLPLLFTLILERYFHRFHTIT